MDYQTRKAFSDDSWMVPGIERVRGGISGNYSHLIALDTANNDDCGVPPVVFTSPLFDPSNVIFLSRGFCGSTCALFAHMLSDGHGVRTIAVGGYNESAPMTFRSFPGGQGMKRKRKILICFL